LGCLIGCRWCITTTLLLLETFTCFIRRSSTEFVWPETNFSITGLLIASWGLATLFGLLL
jgi:hypothetical protein